MVTDFSVFLKAASSVCESKAIQLVEKGFSVAFFSFGLLWDEVAGPEM